MMLLMLNDCGLSDCTFDLFVCFPKVAIRKWSSGAKIDLEPDLFAIITDLKKKSLDHILDPYL